MRISAKILWFQFYIDTTPASVDTVDVEHVATITAYNTANQVVNEALHDMFCECDDEGES